MTASNTGGWATPGRRPRCSSGSSTRRSATCSSASSTSTDQFRCHASLFPTALIAAGRTVAIWDGRPIPAVLPSDRPIVSGAIARDWLKVVVSEADFDASAFEMSALDEPLVVRRSASVAPSTLERLAGRVLTRDTRSEAAAGSSNPEWCADTYAIMIAVP